MSNGKDATGMALAVLGLGLTVALAMTRRAAPAARAALSLAAIDGIPGSHLLLKYLGDPVSVDVDVSNLGTELTPAQLWFAITAPGTGGLVAILSGLTISPGVFRYSLAGRFGYNSDGSPWAGGLPLGNYTITVTLVQDSIDPPPSVSHADAYVVAGPAISLTIVNVV